MSSSSSDPWRRDDDRGDQGDPGAAGDARASSPQPTSPQPTGWERPSSDSSGQPPASGSSAASSESSAPDWPSYPPGTPPGGQPGAAEPTRSFSADQPFSAEQAPYAPYDPQAMPGYGGSSSPYGSNPYEAGPPSPYEASPYPPQPTPYGGYQAYAAPAQHPQAVTAFVLGLLGLVICPPVGIGGLVIGGRARREIDASGGQLGGKGLATAGWVLGIISIVYFVAVAIFIVFAVIVGAGQN